MMFTNTLKISGGPAASLNPGPPAPKADTNKGMFQEETTFRIVGYVFYTRSLVYGDNRLRGLMSLKLGLS